MTSEMLDGRPNVRLDESTFSYEEMNRANRESMALDGIHSVG